MHPLPSACRPLQTIGSCLILSGCVTGQQIGPVTHFSYDLWLQLLCPFVTVAALIVGMRMRRSGRIQGPARAWGLIILSVAVGLPASAYFSIASLILSPDGFVEQAFGSEKSRMEFKQIKVIEFEGTRSFANKKRVNHILACQFFDGNYQNVSVTSLMKQGPLVTILEKAQASGVLVIAGRQD